MEMIATNATALKNRRIGAKFRLFRNGKRRIRATPSLYRSCFVSLSFGRGCNETKENLVSWSLRLALRRSSLSQTPATPSAHLLRRLSGFVLTLAPSRLSHPSFSVGPSSLSDPRLSCSVVSRVLSSLSMTPSSLSMTLSYVSLRLLSQAVVTVDDFVVCLTPSSRSVHLLC
ncbi:hypothetical protein F2Q70_00014348 [Brassica cretica]|uniref:Uncharacterized protein n=1 Tax=Brassica cretica TaxID=69181 RepID=A0A8S9HT64_BRACR|nr:hypothetical protein F2Q70_00014348 [Brassica cretica]